MLTFATINVFAIIAGITCIILLAMYYAYLRKLALQSEKKQIITEDSAKNNVTLTEVLPTVQWCNREFSFIEPRISKGVNNFIIENSNPIADAA